MKNILIIGYPKSGTTWLSRLVGEVLQAPVKGYWNASHDDPATEGLDRESDYCCYKSHISYENLRKQERVHKCIYLYRDPRDIAVSGAYFFQKPVSKLFRLPLINYAYGFYEKNFILPSMKLKMSEDIVTGNTRFAKALGLPWSEHLKPYLKDNDILKISFEELRTEPSRSIKKITDYLDITVDNSQISQAIENQSLKSVKKVSLLAGDRIVREGKLGNWKTELPLRAKSLLNMSLKKELEMLGYPMD
ncbi:MAG: sulfotransferase domain-containing protein [Bacteroidia bacterium]